MQSATTVTFGELLRRHRLAAGLTQEALAERAGLSVRAITDLERGVRRAPYRDTVQRLAEAFGLDAATHAALEAAARPPRMTAAARDAMSPPMPFASGYVLPAPATRLIGRQQEIDDIVRRLAETRLLTLTGPGGVGKTRLALAAAQRALRSDAADVPPYPDGAAFVDLAPIADPTLVASAIGERLGVREEAGRTIDERLIASLRGRRMLLLLDNFEQVIDAAPLLRDLLTGCPDLTIMVTSRVLLRVAGEREFAVPPLAVPETATVDAAALAGSPAVSLFVERADEALPGFVLGGEHAAAVAEICRRLDGLPLAIELAATRVRLLPPRALLERLAGATQASSLRLLTGGRRDAPERQQTLRDTILWSYDLLGVTEQQLFRWLAVFVGGWTVEAAEGVCYSEGGRDTDVLDRLGVLVDSSLVQRRDPPDRAPRFTMLETVREFALDQLSLARETEALRQRHAAHFLDLAETAAPHLRGPEQRRWLNRLADEHENLRAALTWAASTDPDDAGARLLHALYWFWHRRGHLREARGWADTIVARSNRDRSTALRTRTLLTAARVHWELKDRAHARRLVETTIAAARATDDSRILADALCILGSIRAGLGDLPGARPLLEESVRLLRGLDDDWALALALGDLGMAIRWSDPDEADGCFRESLAIWRQQGDGWGMALTVDMYTPLLVRERRFAEARALLEESLAVANRVDEHPEIPSTLRALSDVAQWEGHAEQAVEYAEQALTVSRARGDRPEVARALTRLGNLALLERDRPQAKEHFTAALALFREEDDQQSVSFSLLQLGLHAALDGDLAGAEPMLRESIALSRSIDAPIILSAALDVIASVRNAQGGATMAARLFGAATMMRERGGFGLAAQWHGLQERAVKAVRAALGEEAFAAAWSEGEAMSQDEAVALALEQKPPSPPTP